MQALACAAEPEAAAGGEVTVTVRVFHLVRVCVFHFVPVMVFGTIFVLVTVTVRLPG